MGRASRASSSSPYITWTTSTQLKARSCTQIRPPKAGEQPPEMCFGGQPSGHRSSPCKTRQDGNPDLYLQMHPLFVLTVQHHCNAWGVSHCTLYTDVEHLESHHPPCIQVHNRQQRDRVCVVVVFSVISLVQERLYQAWRRQSRSLCVSSCVNSGGSLFPPPERCVLFRGSQVHTPGVTCQMRKVSDLVVFLQKFLHGCLEDVAIPPSFVIASTQGLWRSTMPRSQSARQPVPTKTHALFDIANERLRFTRACALHLVWREQVFCNK